MRVDVTKLTQEQLDELECALVAQTEDTDFLTTIVSVTEEEDDFLAKV